MRRIHLLILAATIGCDCGDGPGAVDGDGGVVLDDAVTGVLITPTDVRLVIDGTNTAMQAFTVTTVRDDGETDDVTDQATLVLSDPMIGRMDGATFTTGLAGGATDLTATVGPFTAKATITVVVERTIIVPVPGTPDLPADPPGLFSGATDDPARAPSLVYPNDGVMFPPNLGRVEVHFLPGTDNTVFELRFAAAGAAIVVYTRCDTLGDGCLYTTSDDVWRNLSATARGVAPIVITVRGTDDDGMTSGTSADVEMNIAPVDVIGGIYYWTTSNGTAIMRVDFGAPDQQPERFFPFSGGGCYGCHAVSRNGRRMTVSQNGQGDGRFTVIDVEGRAALTSVADDRREQFQTWNPDSDRFAAIYGDDDPPDTNIRIRDGDTGDILESIPVGTEPTHPDWSPRGDRIIYTKVTRHQTSQRPGRGGISYVETLPGGGWTAPVDLIDPTDGLNHYYPAYAPDAQFFVYNQSICAAGEIYNGDCDGDADPGARLWAMAADGGAAIRLDRANAPGVRDNDDDLSTTFPKWAPFVDPKNRDGTGRLMWMTFSSRRQYGLRSPGGSNQLLWMAAVDPDAILAGDDGSFHAFALPFQDLATSNHIAQWTTRIIPPTNTDGGPDPGQRRDGSMCLETGERCEAGQEECCAGLRCVENGPGTFLCRPDL